MFAAVLRKKGRMFALSVRQAVSAAVCVPKFVHRRPFTWKAAWLAFPMSCVRDAVLAPKNVLPV